MSRLNITLTGKQRTFSSDEIIVSKTDLQGRISYVNEVFVRVSQYEEHELLGAAHSVVRHPEMPRAVYKLLWERLQAGHEVFAYIVNLCKSGDHYWVFAHVTPTRDASGRIVSYHSNRRTADANAVATAEGLYARLCDVEARHSRKTDAARAGYDELTRILAQAGQDYDAFAWSL